MKYKIGRKKTVRLLQEIMARHGWTQTAADDWAFFWGNSYAWEAGDLSGPRTVNHFPGFWSIAHKGSLGHLLTHGRERAARAGDDQRWRFFPRTYELPHQHAAFLAAAAADPAIVWIAKPAANTHGGEGQFLLQHPGEAPVRPGWLVQEYLGPTHLLDGRKYTLRVFLLLTSLDPLVVHIYTDGLVKRMSVPYSDAPEDRANRFIHLSNSDVQRRAPGGLLPRLFFPEYRELIAREGGDYDRLWENIRRVSLLTLLAGRETLLRAQRPTAVGQPREYNLWGLDIIVDRDLQPWVLECNGNPSMAVTTTEGVAGGDAEHAQKTALIEETLRMTGVLSPGPEGEWPPARFGGWELLSPGPEAVACAADWFPRRRDRELFARRSLTLPPQLPVPTPPGAVLVDDGLLAYLPGRNRLVGLNAAATAILFHHQEGRTRAEIAALIADGQPAPAPLAALEDQVEATLAEIWGLDAPDPWSEPDDVPPPPPLAAADVATVRDYALGPVRLRVRFSRADLAALVDPVLAHLRTEGATVPAEIIDVIAVKKRIHLRGGPETLTLLNLRRFASALHSLLLHRACAAPGVLTAIHAGAVARGDRGLILAGQSGGGKTTLTAALCHAGFDYLSDEAAVLEAGPRLRPAPVALGLTTEALPLLAGFVAPDRVLPECRRADGTAVHFLPPPHIARAPVPPAALIFPKIAPGAAPALRPIGPVEALARLSRTGLELPRHLGPATAATLIDWLRRTPRFEFSYGDLAPAVERLKNWIDTPAAASAADPRG